MSRTIRLHSTGTSASFLVGDAKPAVVSLKTLAEGENLERGSRKDKETDEGRSTEVSERETDGEFATTRDPGETGRNKRKENVKSLTNPQSCGPSVFLMVLYSYMN